MFLTYLRRELRRRGKQAIVVAIGLAIGIGLVITVSATAAGVKSAQGQVLHSLYGVGTDMTVTKAETAPTTGKFHFGFSPNKGNVPPSRKQFASKFRHLARNRLTPTPGDATLASSDISRIASMHGVSAATGGLELTATSFSGNIPSSNSESSNAYGFAPSFNVTTTTVDGVQISKSGVGPIASSQVTRGHFFSSSDSTALVAVASSSYASQHKLTVGSTVKLGGKRLKLVGIADVSSGSADLYIPLGTAQSLAKLKNKVTTIYVSASSASAVSSLAAAVKHEFPSLTVTTSATLAKEVTGSITSASNLASNLGKWLSWAALLVAFLIAGLLMVAAVSRRVREFGTLKAIGWRTRRIVGQVMGEGFALGIAGGVVGLLLGLGGSAIISAISPSLSADVGSAFRNSGGFGNGSVFGGAPASGGPGRADVLRNAFGGGVYQVLVHLRAPFQADTVILAIVLAVAGGLVAGLFGSWRAARLRPAAALRRIE